MPDAKDEVVETVTDSPNLLDPALQLVQVRDETTTAVKTEIREALKAEARRLSACGSKRNARIVRNTIDRIGL